MSRNCNNMKIIILTDGIPQGDRLVGLFGLDQAEALVNAGHEVLLVAFDSFSLTYRRKLGIYKTKIRNVNVWVYGIPIGRKPLSVCASIAALIFRTIIRRVIKNFGRPDIFHAHFYFQGYLSVKCRDLIRCPIVVTEHSSRINNDNINSAIYRLAAVAYSGADAVVAVGSALQNRIKKYFGIDVFCIPNIIQTSLFDVARSPDPNGYHFVSVANLIPLKNMDLLIESFVKTFSISENISLTIFGEGIEHKKLQDQINATGYAEKIVLAGRVERAVIAREFSRTDCFVLFSKTETFGVAYVEAMAAGLPVIATKCGGPEDFVSPQCGILIKPDDVTELSHTMRKMADGGYSFDSGAIKTYVNDNFSPQAVSDKLYNLYAEISQRG